MTGRLSPLAAVAWVLLGALVGSLLAWWLPSIIGAAIAVGDLLGVTARPS